MVSKHDEFYEKPSKHKQWQERQARPVGTRFMSRDDIEQYRRCLVASYQCNDSDIRFEFQKIVDANDEDRDDCIWLKYKMNCVVAGRPQEREIFTIKLPIPDAIKKMADKLRKEQAAARPRGRQRVLMPPTGAAPTTPPLSAPHSVVITDADAGGDGAVINDAPRPKLRPPRVAKPTITSIPD